LPIHSEAILHINDNPVVRRRGDTVRVLAGPVVYLQGAFPRSPRVSRGPRFRALQGMDDLLDPLPIPDNQGLRDQGRIDRRILAGQHLDGHHRIGVERAVGSDAVGEHENCVEAAAGAPDDKERTQGEEKQPRLLGNARVSSTVKASDQGDEQQPRPNQVEKQSRRHRSLHGACTMNSITTASMNTILAIDLSEYKSDWAPATARGRVARYRNVESKVHRPLRPVATLICPGPCRSVRARLNRQRPSPARARGA